MLVLSVPLMWPGDFDLTFFPAYNDKHYEAKCTLLGLKFSQQKTLTDFYQSVFDFEMN